MEEAGFSAVVLAGGESRRMGRDKAFVDVGGVPLVGRVVEALTAAGPAETLAVGGDRERLGDLGLTTVRDDVAGAGPFAALVTGLRHVRTSRALVVGCDLPDLEPSLLMALIAGLDHADVVVPVTGDRRQYDCVALRRDLLARLEARVADGVRSMHAGLAGTDLATFAVEDGQVLRDVDTVGDLAAARSHR